VRDKGRARIGLMFPLYEEVEVSLSYLVALHKGCHRGYSTFLSFAFHSAVRIAQLAELAPQVVEGAP
jgi:hypothetical protein